MATTNILIETFTGLGLPPTLSLPLPSTSPISDVFSQLSLHLPPLSNSRLRLTTTTGKLLSPSSSSPVSTLLSSSKDTTAANGTDLLTLRLTVPLCGGKGGFGSQLRAAGGRMSSRKRKGQENNDSCRNLDGRRMRTVKEAKALAQYLETKPDMDKKEREKRKERWAQVIEAADEKIRGGGSKANERFDDVKWLEEKEEGRERAREAVIRAMKANGGRVPSPPGLNSDKSSTSEDLEEEEDKEDGGEGTSKSSEDEEEEVMVPVKKKKRFLDFDDDDDDSSEEEMGDIPEEEEEEEVVGKGKGKAIAA
ncbi:hypothetical protein ABW19_dt0202107 [Dactylella cylindrospora]|nr:hypothetical protein ABW19_dt0202107 [Dactylella cylindrospora]